MRFLDKKISAISADFICFLLLLLSNSRSEYFLCFSCSWQMETLDFVMIWCIIYIASEWGFRKEAASEGVNV